MLKFRVTDNWVPDEIAHTHTPHSHGRIVWSGRVEGLGTRRAPVNEQILLCINPSTFFHFVLYEKSE